jgi:hypothetical protein
VNIRDGCSARVVRASGVSDRTVTLLRAPHDATLSL